jgi:hypothetical protein
LLADLQKMGAAAKAVAAAVLLTVHVYGFVAHQSLTGHHLTSLQAESGADTLPSFSSRRSQTGPAADQTEVKQVDEAPQNELHREPTN